MFKFDLGIFILPWLEFWFIFSNSEKGSTKKVLLSLAKQIGQSDKELFLIVLLDVLLIIVLYFWVFLKF